MEQSRLKKTNGTAKISHNISKLNAVTTSSSRIIPTIQIVQILAPRVFRTDPANFRDLVQELTGDETAQKKIKGTVGAKKNECFHLKKKNKIQKQSAESHSPASTVIYEHLSTEELIENEYHVVSPLAGNHRDSLGEDGVQVCDNFSDLFGGLEELGFFSSLSDSDSMLPELPTFYPPTVEQIDYRSSIYCNAFNSFCQ